VEIGDVEALAANILMPPPICARSNKVAAIDSESFREFTSIASGR
jgi:hypothetical protein